MGELENFINQIITHEGLVPYQTPFRINPDNPKMKDWVSMFDDTIKTQLDPNFKKPKGRENFLFLKNQEDLQPAVTEQFRRYNANPGNYGDYDDTITIGDAIRIFDQTGADGKIESLRQQGLNPDLPLSLLFNDVENEVYRQVR